MRVELLWWEGCPSHPQALADLRDALRAEGIDEDVLEVSAHRLRGAGRGERLPWLAHDPGGRRGRVPPGPGEPLGLACRVYRLRDGRVSPVPDPADVRERLRRVKETQ